MAELIQNAPWIAPIASIVVVSIISCVALLVAALKAMNMKVQSKKSVHEIALEVLAGEWGVDQDRKDRLLAAGYDYAEVQAEVNKIIDMR